MKLPPFGSIAPELATLVVDVPTSGPYVYELKYDGYRVMGWLDHRKVRLATRRGNDWSDKFREVARAVAKLPAKTAIVDGEVAYVDEAGRTDFQRLQTALGRSVPAERARLVYHVFDLLYLDGVDLRGEPLATRKTLLRALLAGAELPLRLSDDVADGKTFYREVQKLGLEGIIGKRSDRGYVSGRSADWLKLKCLQRQELVIVGFTPQKETRAGLGALVLAVYEASESGAPTLRYAGKVGTGFTQATLRNLEQRLRRIAVSEPPLTMPVRLPQVTWVSPELVAEIRFSEWTHEGILRQPSFRGLREDKDPAEVFVERPRSPRED